MIPLLSVAFLGGFDMQFCIECGERLSTGDRFCHKCGTTVAILSQQLQQQPTQQPLQPPQQPLQPTQPEPLPVYNQPVYTPQTVYNPQPEPPPQPVYSPQPEYPSQTVYIPQPEYPPQPDFYQPPPKPERKKLGAKKLIIIFSSIAAVIAIAVTAVIFLNIQANRAAIAAAYDEAVMHMDGGRYAQAKEMFIELGDYNDAQELVIECQKRMDYNLAMQFMDRGNHREAKTAFDALGSYRNSSELAIECQRIIDYDEATQLMNNGKYPEAKAAFDVLGSFRDSAALAADCQTEIDYINAFELMESDEHEQALAMFITLGTYKESVFHAEWCSNWINYKEAIALMAMDDHIAARVLLEPLVELWFEDSLFLFQECSNVINYNDGLKAFEEDLFYTAYRLFRMAGGYSDANEKMALCIQDQPASGQFYRNPDYSGTAVSLRIRTPRNDTRPTFIKIYTENGIHVASVFIRGGDSPTVRLPANTYMIKSAYGENWFGPEEMFGDDNAYYQTLLLEGRTTYAFSRNYNYTLTLRDAVDGNVGAQNESRTGF